jgi:hypothetical protein
VGLDSVLGGHGLSLIPVTRFAELPKNEKVERPCALRLNSSFWPASCASAHRHSASTASSSQKLKRAKPDDCRADDSQTDEENF